MGLLYLVHSDVLVENLMVAQKVKTFSNTIFIKPPPFRFILSQLISSLHSSLSFTKLFFCVYAPTYCFDSEAVALLQGFQRKLYIFIVSHFLICLCPPSQQVCSSVHVFTTRCLFTSSIQIQYLAVSLGFSSI